MFIFSNKREDYFLLLLMGGPAATGLLQKLDGQLGVLGFVLETGTGKGGVGYRIYQACELVPKEFPHC